MTAPTPWPTCAVCGDPKAGHDRIHPFTPPGETLPTNFFRPEKQQTAAGNVQLPYDVVVRQALLDKGIITYDDLQAAAEKVTAIVSGGEIRGDPGPEQG